MPKLQFLLDIWWLLPVLCTQLVKIVSGHLICKIVFALVKSEHSILIGLNHVWNSIWDETGRLIYTAWREIFPARIRRLVGQRWIPLTAGCWAYLLITFLSPSYHLPITCLPGDCNNYMNIVQSQTKLN